MKAGLAIACSCSCATLVLLVLPEVSAASSTGGVATVAPRPLPVRAQGPARADRPDAATPGVATTASAAIPTGTWKPLGPAPIGPPDLANAQIYGGPNSGRITGLTTATVPGASTQRIVAATAGGGIWTSDDRGTTWTPRTDTAPDLAIGSIASDPSNPGHLIAGTGEANQCGDCFPGFGILASTDGGTTWALQNPGSVFTNIEVAEVAIDPSNSNHQFAATTGGLFVTSNGGTSWAKPTSASYLTFDGKVTAVAIDPVNSNIVYIGGPLGSSGTHSLAKSPDGGTTWTASDIGISAPGQSQSPLVALAIALSQPATMYASVGGVTIPVALYRSTNGGASWVKQTTAPDYTGQAYSYGSGTAEQGWYDNVLAVDPTNASHVLAGGIALVETKNGGGSWTNVDGHNFGAAVNRLHPDHHALTFASDHSIWIGDDGGIYHYTPSSNTVADANGNLDITQLYYGFNVVGSTLLAGAQDNASMRTSSPSLGPWTGIFSGDGGPSAITSNDTSIQFIEADQNLYVTTDAFSSTLNNITPPAERTTGALFTPPDLVIPNTTSPGSPTVYFGGQDLYRSTNATAASPTWTKVTSAGSNCISGGICVSALAASANGQDVYAGFTNGTIEVSTNRGVSFSKLKAQTLAATFVTGLSVNPSNPKAITASFSSAHTRTAFAFPHIEQYTWSTAPGAGTWTTITGTGIPLAVNHVIYDNSALVAATDEGVYATGSVAGGSTVWSLVGTGLPNVQVQDLYFTSSGLYAITHGRGAWKL